MNALNNNRRALGIMGATNKEIINNNHTSMLVRIGMIKTIEDLSNFKEVKKNKALKVDLSTVEKTVAKLAQLGFIPGSMVGLITSLVANADVLMNNELNKQFLVEGSLDVDMFKFSKLFILGAAEERIESRYNSILTNKVYQVTDIFGRTQFIAAAFKSDILAFADAIKSLKSICQEDLVRIGKDLEVLGRVLQELEIDSAKDASKKEGIPPINEIMNVSAAKVLSSNLDFVNNMKALKDYKRDITMGKVVEDVEFYYGIQESEVTLYNIYEAINEEQTRFLSTDECATLTQEQIDKRLAKIKRETLSKAIIVDEIGQLAISLSKVYNEELGELAAYYKASDMSLFDKYNVELVRVNQPEPKYARETEAAAAFKMKEMAITLYDMINSTFTHKGIGPKAEIIAPLARRAYYTAGTKRGFSAESLFAVGVYMAKKRMDKGTIQDSKSFRFKAMELMFGNELKWDLNPEVMDTAALELDLPLGLELELDGVIEFIDGQAEVIVDGEIDYINCLSDDEFTGYALVELEDGEVVFKAVIDQYAFEELDFMLVNELTDLYDTNTASTLDEILESKQSGQMNKLFYSCAKMKLQNTMDMNELKKAQYLNKVGKSTSLWSQLFTKVVNEDVFTLGFAAENNKHTVYAYNQDGRARLFGRGVASNMNNKGTATVYATPHGALVEYK